MKMEWCSMAMKSGKRQKGSSGYNRKATEDFLNRNRQKSGVVETESGLQYLIVEESEGPKPSLEHTVVVHQRISLIDGTPVDDTYQKDIPAEFTMKEAIPGYREGLMLMSVGSRYKFFIPPDLAWGKRGAGAKIGPNALLVIDARLLEIF